MTTTQPARPAALNHGSERARRGCRCDVCRPVESGGMIRRPIVTDVVVAAIHRHLTELDAADYRPELAAAALRLAVILDSQTPEDRTQHRAATVELVELLGLLGRERTIRTAASRGRAAGSH